MGMLDWWTSLKVLTLQRSDEGLVDAFLAMILPRDEALGLGVDGGEGGPDLLQRQCEMFISTPGFATSLQHQLTNLCAITYERLWDEIARRLGVSRELTSAPNLDFSQIGELVRFLVGNPDMVSIVQRAAKYPVLLVMAELQSKLSISATTASAIVGMVIQSMQTEVRKPSYLKAAQLRGMDLNLWPEEVLELDKSRLDTEIARPQTGISETTESENFSKLQSYFWNFLNSQQRTSVLAELGLLPTPIEGAIPQVMEKLALDTAKSQKLLFSLWEAIMRHMPPEKQIQNPFSQ